MPKTSVTSQRRARFLRSCLYLALPVALLASCHHGVSTNPRGGRIIKLQCPSPAEIDFDDPATVAADLFCEGDIITWNHKDLLGHQLADFTITFPNANPFNNSTPFSLHSHGGTAISLPTQPQLHAFNFFPYTITPDKGSPADPKIIVLGTGPPLLGQDKND
jgi:hypothetical protein